MKKCELKRNNNGLTVSLIAVIVLLSVGLITSVAYNFLGGFYYCRVIEYDKMLGEEQTIEITGEGAYVCACNFSGSLVVGANVNQVINVQAKELEKPVYLRAKYKVNNLTEDAGFLFGYTNWVLSDDGYLYFNQQLTSHQRVGLCDTIKINLQSELKSSTNYIIIFIVESSETAWEYVSI